MKEASSVKHVSTRQYFFVPSTFEPINGAITFGPRNLNQVTLLYEDELVLELKVARLQVCKILINPGNPLNLIHVLTYKQMGNPLYALVKCLPGSMVLQHVLWVKPFY